MQIIIFIQRISLADFKKVEGLYSSVYSLW